MKCSNHMQGFKSAIFEIGKWLGWPYPVRTGPQEFLPGFLKSFLFWIHMNYWQVKDGQGCGVSRQSLHTKKVYT